MAAVQSVRCRSTESGYAAHKLGAGIGHIGLDWACKYVDSLGLTTYNSQLRAALLISPNPALFRLQIYT
ncbi:unnamed protein product [Citrullus colocynthis]|uniref:Uncharacterized protein n=1 Tax=Citrullus colocynthis TaxID=252529 RepID=A0ABP0YEF5_9ROSI